MPEIRAHSDFVTQITTAEAEDGKQDELLALMSERARFMTRQPGFISISLHRSLDGTRIVNYVQWACMVMLTNYGFDGQTCVFHAGMPAIASQGQAMGCPSHLLA